MAYVQKHAGWEVGDKIIFIENRHEGLSYGIPHGAVGKIVEIIVYDENNYILHVYNPIWEKKGKESVLSFWPDEISLVVGNVQVLPEEVVVW